MKGSTVSDFPSFPLYHTRVKSEAQGKEYREIKINFHNVVKKHVRAKFRTVLFGFMRLSFGF